MGQPTLSGYFTAVVFERNVLAGGPAGAYPAGNYFPSEAEFLTSFVNAAGGDFTLVAGTSFRTSATDGGSCPHPGQPPVGQGWPFAALL